MTNEANAKTKLIDLAMALWEEAPAPDATDIRRWFEAVTEGDAAFLEQELADAREEARG